MNVECDVEPDGCSVWPAPQMPDRADQAIADAGPFHECLLAHIKEGPGYSTRCGWPARPACSSGPRACGTSSNAPSRMTDTTPNPALEACECCVAARMAYVVEAQRWRICLIGRPCIPAKGSHHQILASNTGVLGASVADARWSGGQKGPYVPSTISKSTSATVRPPRTCCRRARASEVAGAS